jgi:EAL domain-containing protein (putative c-di-GMP-specific phosphodiesterase class I)
VEALVRWQHPEQGLVPPGRFIPVAEESGLIVSIGAWVLREACRQGAHWQRGESNGGPAVTVAVNLSAVQFRRGNLEQTVAEALADSGLKPERLELELTESILIAGTDSTLQTLHHLKELGVKLSIDDFGTGYSSLSYLKRFPLDKVKIDQSFVRNLATDPENRAIVRAIVQMADSFQLRTIAEGVEDQATLEELRGLGCAEAQGYYFARPLPPAELAIHFPPLAS